MSQFDFSYWHTKILYDLAGYLTAFLVTWFFYRKVLTKSELPNPFSNNADFRVFIDSNLNGYELP